MSLTNHKGYSVTLAQAKSCQVTRTTVRFAIDFAIGDVALLGSEAKESHSGISCVRDSLDGVNQSLRAGVVSQFFGALHKRVIFEGGEARRLSRAAPMEKEKLSVGSDGRVPLDRSPKENTVLG